MKKKITLDVQNTTIRIPSDFTKQFQRNKNHRKIKAEMIYNEPNICTKESLIILVEANDGTINQTS